jgi:hypothetical protein
MNRVIAVAIGRLVAVTRYVKAVEEDLTCESSDILLTCIITNPFIPM